jgi:hypothetical protein
MPSYLHDGQGHVQTHTYINRLLVVNDAGAMATIIPLRLLFLTEPSAPANSSAYRSLATTPDGHATAVAFSPTQSIRSTSLITIRWKRLAQKSYLAYILSGCTQNSLVSAKKNGKFVAPPAPAPCKLDPSVRVLPSLRSTLTAGATFDYTPVAALGVVSFFCPTHGNPATMLAFLPNKFKPARSSRG